MELEMASTSCAKQSPLPMREPVMSNVQYPAPAATYEDVTVSPKLFMETLEKFHAAMGTKFMIPIIGGKELNLHRLFVEVTSRGGIEKVIREKRWKEVTSVFNFPSTATNASFVLRKYYGSLLQKYEQLYHFKARSWSPVSPVPLQSPLISQCSAQVTVQPSPEYQATEVKQKNPNIAELRGAMPGSSASLPVMGVIDGKFEGGLSCYCHRRFREAQRSSLSGTTEPSMVHDAGTVERKHARLKPLYPGKDREISRMIGELWNKINDSQKVVYQERALRDKERYKIEMEGYRERLRTGKVITDAVPLQQWIPGKDSETVKASVRTEETGEGSLQNDSISSESDSEDDDRTAEKDSDMEASPV
ncbi:hypothetical protein OIU78_018489 [Salix suchowensis]|nr:hypothetical protein OIU78_018489 [Salix suchowensis]